MVSPLHGSPPYDLWPVAHRAAPPECSWDGPRDPRLVGLDGTPLIARQFGRPLHALMARLYALHILCTASMVEAKSVSYRRSPQHNMWPAVAA